MILKNHEEKIQFLLLHQLYFAEKMKAERKFIKEEKRRNAVAFQVFLTQINFSVPSILRQDLVGGAIITSNR